MKKLAAILACVLVCGAMSAQLKVSIMGDSYSTFTGSMPKYYDTFYPNQFCGVTEQSQQWWQQVIDANGWVLERTTHGQAVQYAAADTTMTTIRTVHS